MSKVLQILHSFRTDAACRHHQPYCMKHRESGKSVPSLMRELHAQVAEYHWGTIPQDSVRITRLCHISCSVVQNSPYNLDTYTHVTKFKALYEHFTMIQLKNILIDQIVLVQRKLDKSTFLLRDFSCLRQEGFFRHNKALNRLCNLFISVRFIFPLTFLRRGKIKLHYSNLRKELYATRPFRRPIVFL